MPDSVEFEIVIPGGMSSRQYETLVARISETIDVTEAGIAAADWDLVQDIRRFVGSIPTTSAAIGKFTQVVRDWTAKQAPPPPEVILERPRRPRLVVTAASDEDIARWLSE